jgi:hypothetical protein
MREHPDDECDLWQREYQRSVGFRLEPEVCVDAIDALRMSFVRSNVF